MNWYAKTTNRTLENIKTDIKDLNNRIMHQQDSIDKFHTTIQNVVHIGTDVRYQEYGHSWAVVCVEGNINIVKFVDLDRKDAREILDFLKHFEAGKHCVDSSYKQMFLDGLFKF